MKKKVIPIILLLAVASAVGYVYLRSLQEGEGTELTVYGNVDIREVTLAFRVGGRVEDVLKDEGDPVQAGELLAVLDSVPYQQQRAQAEAELARRKGQLLLLRNGYRPEEVAQAKAKASEARNQLDNAEQTLARQEQLQSSRAGTDQQLDDARTRRNQAAAALEVAEANLRLMQAGFREEEILQAEAGVRLAEAMAAETGTRLEDTRLLAPSDGILRTRVLEKGAVVSAGSPVFVLSLQDKPWVRAYIPETSLGKVSPGMKVQVFTDSRPGKPYAGHIGFISPTAEFTPKSIQTEDLRTNLVYRFRIILEETDDQLRQGMPVTVKLSAVAAED